jgi:DNA-binding SARP family transcriptional activator/tetratricopeptide (TPR) repeat protein
VGVLVRPQALLRLYLLGRFEVVREDAPIPAHAWRRRRPADLLKLVALAPGRSLSREQVVEALWPDKDPASGANNLHRALYDLRQIVGGRFVDIERGAVSLGGDVWLDVDAFEAAAGRGDQAGLAEAVSLYGGDLSPEDQGGSWIVARRAALRARFVAAAAPLARAAAAEGDGQGALPLLRRLVEADPGGEEAHRLLVRLLAAGGRRAEALRQLDAGEAALRAAGVAPSEELRALRGAIQAGELGPAAPPPPLDGARRAARRLLGAPDPAPVRGRGPLLLLLEALVERGSGAVVLLGERGVGKTRLAVEGARLAQARGAAVVCGIGGTRPGAPFAIFSDALPLAELPGGLGAEGVRRAAADGVVAALRRVGEGRPTLLLLDDLHLADESSLGLVHDLARRAAELRLMIVATVAEEAIHAGTPIQTALAHLDCGRLARGVRVPRLSLAGTCEQIADLHAGPVPATTAEHVYRVTDGSPLLVEEVVRAQRETGQAVPGDPAAAIRARLARLGERAGALLAAAAVCGARCDFELVRHVSGLTAHEVAEALEACLEAKVLDVDGAGYHFHHALVREALYDGLAPERRAALHAAVADALEARAGGEPPAELVAYHRRRAGDDRRALRPLLAAGHRAAARAGLREALAFYAAALELSARTGGLAPEGRRELLEATGRVQLALGETEGAALSFEEAADLDSPGDGAALARARVLRLAAVAHACAGRLVPAHAAIDAGVSLAEAGGGDGVAPLLHLAAQLRLHEGRGADAVAAAEACRAAAERGGEPDLARRALELAILGAALEGAPLPGDPTPPVQPYPDPAPDPVPDLHLALWDRDLVAGDGVGATRRLAALVAARARLAGAPEGLASARAGEGAAALAAGDLDLAEDALREALGAHRAAGSALGEALALERLASLLTARGRLGEGLDAVDEGIVAAERGVLRRHALVRLHATEARNRLAAGALHAAEDAIREASETAARHGDCVACDASFRPEAVRVLLLRGRVAEAAAEAAQLEEIARTRGGAALAGVARLARARVLAAEGQPARALLALGEARAALLAAGHRLEAARCARLEVRLRGPGAALPEEVRALDALVVVDADA